MIDQLPINTNTKTQLKAIISSPSHAYLLAGPMHSGKKRAALRVAVELAKPQLTATDLERIARGEHEHVLMLAPSEGKSIKISQIKDLIYSLSLKTFSSALPRFVIIEEAHLLTAPAANALLKSLEEPPEGTIFFLLAASVAQVLPTIASRCVPIIFLPPDQADLRAQIKKGTDDEVATDIIELAAGRPALAMRLAEDEALRERYRAARDLAAGFSEGSLTTRFKIARDVSSEGESAILLSALIARHRQEFLASGQGSQVLERLLVSERCIDANVNPRLVLEQLALELSK